MAYIKLNTEKKQQWLEALRSGNYKQITSKLKTEDGFCCLGVYADAVEHVDWQPNDNPNLANDFFISSGEFCEEILPGSMIDLGTQSEITRMNDQEGDSFNAIADWVEENL